MRIRLFTFVLLPLCLAMAMGLLVVNGGTGHAQEPFVDLAVTTEIERAFQRMDVTNHGSQTAHGVRVEIEIPGWTVNRSQSAPDVGTFHYPADNPSKFIWEIGTLPGGETVSDIFFQPQGFNSVPGKGGRNQPGVFARYLITVTHDFPAEADFHLHNNYAEFVYARYERQTDFASNALFSVEAEVISDVASLQSGDDVVFGITATYRKKAGNIEDFAVSDDTIVNIQFPPSLAYKEHSVASDLDFQVMTEYVRDSGGGADQWKIGDVIIVAPLTYTLTLTATLTSDDVTEEQCLTAEISGTPEEISQADRLDNIAVSCVYLQPTDASAPTIISDGFVSLITWYDCVGDAAFPCDSADSLELVALRDTAASVPISADRAWQRSDPVIHIREPDGRTLNLNGDQVWSTGMSHFGNLPPSIGTGRPGRPGVTTVVRTDHLDLETAIDADFWGRPDDTYPTWERGEIKVEVSGPGEVSSWYNDQGAIAASYGSATNGVMYDSYAGDADVWLAAGDGSVGWSAPVYWEFSELGTYKLTVTIGTEYDADGPGTSTADPVSYSDTETYTFYVGPIADLAVASAWQTAQGVTVVVVNNGPDPSPGARVELDTGESCAIGPLPPISEAAVCTITGAQVAGESATVTVVDDVRFEACGEGHGHGHEPYIDATEAECVNDPDGKWLSVDMYDPNPNNDTRGITDGPPIPASAGVQRASMVIQSHRVNWKPVEELNGWPVSHYQVERLDPENGRWKAVGLVSEPPYDDTDEDRGTSPRYRVRAVNTRGHYGPWAETGVSGTSGLPRLTLSVEPTTIYEPDDTGAVTVATVRATLNKASGQDVDITVGADPAPGSNPAEDGDYMLSDNVQMMIPAGMLEAEGVVTIRALADDDGDNERVSVSAAAAHVLPVDSVVLTIQDDDVAGLTLGALSPAELSENRQGANSGTYMVELDTAPSADVTVTLTTGDDITVQPDRLTFTMVNWDQPQTVTVTAKQDHDAVDDTATVTHVARGSVEYPSIRELLTLTIRDDDKPDIGVRLKPTTLDVIEGKTGKKYTVWLGTEPVGNVVIDLSSNNEDVTVSPASFTLHSNNWREHQGYTVTVSAGHDEDGEADTAMIRHTINRDRTTAEEYCNDLTCVQVGDVRVDVSDDDAPGVTVSTQTLSIGEGRSGGYDVRLNTAPAGDVTVRVSSSNRDVTTEPVDLVFTADNWNRGQRVTVHAGTDADAADDTATLSHTTASPGDPKYQNLSGPTVDVAVRDPDRPGVTVGPLSPSVVYEAGRRTEDRNDREEPDGFGNERFPSFYTVRLDAKPTGNVVIEVKSDNTKVTVSPSELTFTPSKLSHRVEVVAANDADKDDEKATITHTVIAARSADEYDGLAVASLDLAVDDNDNAGATLIVSEPLVVSEDGRRTATYWVVLDTRPDGTVGISIEPGSGDQGKVKVEPSWLYLSGGYHGRIWPDWDMPQAITVTAEDGAAGDTVTLIHRIADINAADWDYALEGTEVGRLTVRVE